MSFKGKIHAGPQGRPLPLVADFIATAPLIALKPGRVIVSVAGVVSPAETMAGYADGFDRGMFVIREEQVTQGILQSAQNVGGVDVTLASGKPFQAYELEVGAYFNIRVAAGTSISQYQKYGIDDGFAVALPEEPTGDEILFLIADESSAAGAERLVRFRVASA